MRNMWVVVVLSGLLWGQIAVAEGVSFWGKEEQAVFSGGDGSCVEEAVVIEGRNSYSACIEQEYEYLAREFGRKDKDWKMVRQRYLSDQDKYYDEITIELLPSHTQKIIYFDMSKPQEEFKKEIDR